MAIDGTNYQVRSTFAVKLQSDRPAADANNIGHLYHVLQEGLAYISVDDSHQSATPSGTFATIPTRTDLHIVGVLPTNLNNLSTGDYYYHAGGDPARGGFEWYEVVVMGTKQLQNVIASRPMADSRTDNTFGVAWLGTNADSTEALAFTYELVPDTNYFFHNSALGVIQRLTNSTYSGPTVTPHYRWLAVGGSSGGAEQSNDFIGNVTIDQDTETGIALTITKTDAGGSPVVRMVHPDNSGNGQRPFNARRDGESDYFEVNGRLGGTSDNPGIGLGTGSGVRDVQLYRGGTNQLRTPDQLSAASLILDTALAVAEGGTGATTAAAARTALGLGTAAVVDTGTGSGDVPVLDSSGELADSVIPDGMGGGRRFGRRVSHLRALTMR